MARSLEQAASAAGHPAHAVDALMAAHEVAMQPRVASLPDDHHPAYLHPGRTVLVLLRDVGDPAADLTVAALLESEDETLRVPDDVIGERLGTEVVARLERLPVPGGEDLVERLVGLPPELASVPLAERLDQVRHLHLRSDLRAHWAERHEEVLRVWLPLAERSGTKLATRFAHWERTFAKRLRLP